MYRVQLICSHLTETRYRKEWKLEGVKEKENHTNVLLNNKKSTAQKGKHNSAETQMVSSTLGCEAGICTTQNNNSN